MSYLKLTKQFLEVGLLLNFVQQNVDFHVFLTLFYYLFTNEHQKRFFRYKDQVCRQVLYFLSFVQNKYHSILSKTNKKHKI